MQKCHFNPFHHRGTCTRPSSFPNIQGNTSHFWIIQTIISGFSNQLILLFLQGWSLLCCKMVMARRMVPRSERFFFLFKRENTSLLSWLPKAWREWLGHHLSCSWHCRGCKPDRNSQCWTQAHLLYSTVSRNMHFLNKNSHKNLLLNKE